MTRIELALGRRPDLSTLLVHLTKRTETDDPWTVLWSIIRDRKLKAGDSKLGMKPGLPNQQCACFTETPLEHIWTMTGKLEGRSVRLEPYGIVFSKAWARRSSCNPVWYLDITPGKKGFSRDWLTNDFNMLLTSTDVDVVQAAGRLAPFIEQMGPTNTTRKEFWWEREWRHVGDLKFKPADVVMVLAPESSHDWLLDGFSDEWPERVPPLVDVDWGPERTILALSGARHEWPWPQ